MRFPGTRFSTRPPDETPDRHGANWLLASTVAAVLLHAGRVPAWLLLVSAALITWSYLSANHAWRPPGWWLRMAFVLLITFAVYRDYGQLLGREPGIVLLTGLVCLKLLELKRVRDYLLTVFLLCFLVLGAFLFSHSVLTTVYGAAVIGCLLVTMVHVSQPRALSVRESVRLAGGILGRALPLVLILYLLFPRVQGSLWGMPEDAFGGSTGLTDEVRMGTVNQLVTSDAIAFRADFDSAIPEHRDLYWRALLLRHWNGRIWSQGIARPDADPGYAGGGEPVRYATIMEPSNRHWLPSLGLPASVPEGARLEAGYVLETRRRIRERRRFTMSSHLAYNTGELHPEDRRRALQLPTDTSPRVLELASSWRRQSASDEEVVQAALDMFREQPFVYTLTPPLLGERPVEEFLFDTRRGFCEHFASAFTVLMRGAGIPARIVLGYQGGRTNYAGEYLVVRQSDAHSWVEVWLDGRGWVRTDPTAAVAPERVELGIDAVRRLTSQGVPLGSLSRQDVLRAIRPGWLEQWTGGGLEYWDALNMAWQRWVLEYGPDQQRTLMRWLGFETPRWLSMVATMAAGLAAVMLLLAAAALWPRRDPDPVRRAWERFCRKLARAGVARQPHEGPVAFAERAGGHMPQWRREIRAIAGLYADLHYGSNPSPRARRELLARVGRLHVPPGTATGSSSRSG